MQTILPTLLILVASAAVTIAAVRFHASRAHHANRIRRLFTTARQHREMVRRYREEQSSITH